MKKGWIKHISLANRILLGLLMLIPGLFKLFSFGPEGVSGMLSGLGFPAPMFFAWILILSEILFGLAIIAKYKLEYTVIPPIIILLVASFTAHLAEMNTWIMHLALITNYILIAYRK